MPSSDISPQVELLKEACKTTIKYGNLSKRGRRLRGSFLRLHAVSFIRETVKLRLDISKGGSVL